MPGDFDSDALLSFIGQLGKEVDNLKAKITSLNETGGKGMGNLADQTDRFGKIIEKYTRGPVKAMDTAVAGLTKTLVGSGGLALGLAGIAKSFDVFSVGELQIRNFATNTGFSVENIKNLRVQLSAAGMNAGEVSRGIAAIGGKAQEVLALQETAPFYQQLRASEPAMARQFLHLLNMGKQQEALNYLQKRYNEGNDRFKVWLGGISGYGRAAFEAGKVGMEGLIEPWHFNDEEAIKYHKTMTNLGTIGEGVWTSMTYTMLDSISKMIDDNGGIGALNKKAHEFATGFKGFFNTYVMPTLEATVTDIENIVKAFGAIDAFVTKWTGKDDKSPRMGIGGITSEKAIIDRMNENKKDQTSEDRLGVWDWLKKNMGFTSEAKADTLPIGTMPGLQKEVVETDKDTNKLLGDMRDIFQKWDQLRESVVVGGGGTQTASLGPGGGGLGATTASDSGSPSRSLPASLGERQQVDTPGVFNTVRYNNPGAQYPGESSKAFGSTGYGVIGGGHLIANFPTPVHGAAANMKNLSDKYTGMTIAAAMKMWSGGHRSVPGPGGKNYDPNMRITSEMLRDPEFIIPFMKSIASGEAPGKYPMSDEQWKQAFEWYQHGSIPPGAAAKGRDGSSARVDKGLRADSGPSPPNGTARVDIDFGNRVEPGSLMSGASPFIKTNIQRSPQAPIAGGGVTDFNQYSFE
jgi:hypothetical protein